MLTTPERIAANRANSLQSTGPKTQAGKEISRRNAIKHGLTGQGIALPDEDAPAVEAAFQRHFDEMKPNTRAGAVLVYQVAWADLKLQRFRAADTAITSQRILDAGFAFDDAQVARRDEARARLFKDPAAQLAVLSRFQAGAEWVIEAWGSLDLALSSGMIKNWRQAQFDLFEALLGHSPEFPSYDDATFWNLAAKGDQSTLDDREMFAGNSPAARCQDARDKLIAVAEREMDRWEAILATATASTAIARANAIKAARYDASKEGQLARKYEAATTRELNKALKDFKAVEAEFADPEPIAESADPVEACVEVGSFFPGIEPGPALPDAEASEAEDLSPIIAHPSQIPGSGRSDVAPASVLAFEAGEDRRS